MRTTSSLMNGGLIGFGLGFIAASLALQHLVIDYIPKYASLWQFRGVLIVGGAGLLVGLLFEGYERLKQRRNDQDDFQDEE